MIILLSATNHGLISLVPFITEYAYNHPETTWQSRDPSDPDATSSTNKDFQLSYYKDHFIHQGTLTDSLNLIVASVTHTVLAVSAHDLRPAAE
jgi:hypothetical protein